MKKLPTDRDQCIAIFWSNVEKQDGCWRWIGKRKHKCGYGEMMFCGRRERSHRISWMIHNGAVPDGLHVLHECDNPECCNPDHLFLGTQLDNDRDRDAKGRNNPGWVPGSKNGCAKLTEADIPKIRELLRSGIQARLIAVQFGVSKDMINRIRSGRNWKHVPETQEVVAA